MPAYTVFISHSSRDRWIARQVDRCLRELPEVNTFLDDKDIQGGQGITEAVRTALLRCHEAVFLLSSASAGSDWVKAEMGAAWVLEKRIVVLLDKLSPKDVPQVISDKRSFDLNDFERYLDDVRARIHHGEA